MTPQPRIFISAVSAELKGARDLVAKTLTSLGYEPDWQDIFPTDGGTIFAMLTGKLESCAAVIHLVGQRYGFEAPEPHPHYRRVSYTQFEALHARALGKKVIVIFCDGWPIPDDLLPEPKELNALQRTYREGLLADEHLYHSAENPAQLELLIRRLRDDLAHLRNRFRQSVLIGAILLILIAGGTVVLIYLQHLQGGEVHAVQAQNRTLITEQHLQVIEVRAVLIQTETVVANLKDLRDAMSSRSGVGQNREQKTPPESAFPEPEKQKDSSASGVAAGTMPSLDHTISPSKTSGYASGHGSTRGSGQASHNGKAEKGADSVSVGFSDPALVEPEALRDKDRFLAEAAEPIRKAVDALRAAGNAARMLFQYRRALEHLQTAAVLTNRERNGMEWANVQLSIANVLQDAGRDGEAELVYEQVLVEYRRTRGEADEELLDIRNNLANTLNSQGKSSSAEAEHRAVMAIRTTMLGPTNPAVLSSRNNLAVTLGAQGKYAEAEAEYREIIAISTKVLGPDHPNTLMSRDNLGWALYSEGKYLEAETEHQAVLTIRSRVLGPDDIASLSTRNNLANDFNAQNKSAAAEQEYRTILLISMRILGPDHPDTLATRNNLANALDAQGKSDAAVAELRAVLTVRLKIQGSNHPNTLATLANLAVVLQKQNKISEALEFARQAHEGGKQILAPGNPYLNVIEEVWKNLNAHEKAKQKNWWERFYAG